MNSEKNVGVFRMMRQHRTNFQNSALCTADDEDLEKLQTQSRAGQTSKSQQFPEVSILSPDQVIRDFLREIIAFQGYQHVETTDPQEAFWNMVPCQGQIVFLDGAYLVGCESEKVHHWVKEFIQAMVGVFVLGDRRWSTDFSRTLTSGNCHILWKPLDYRQIGLAMADVNRR